MTTVNDDELRAAIREAATDGRAPCRALLAIAERLGVKPAEVGHACNEMNVRIRGCQLGCFR